MGAAKVDKIFKEVKSCAESVYEELGPGWTEAVYQKAMEVSLRVSGLKYESLKKLPLEYKGYNVGDCELDLVVWVEGKNPIGIVVDLKVESAIKESHDAQVKRYIRELKKAEEGKRKVHNQGLVIAFGKDAMKQIEWEEAEGVLFAVVDEAEPPELKGTKKDE